MGRSFGFIVEGCGGLDGYGMLLIYTCFWSLGFRK